MSRSVLCEIVASRQETISQVINTSAFKLSLTNVSTIPYGSAVVDSLGNTVYISSISGDIIYTFGTLTLAQNDTITITSTFRFSNDEIIVADINGDDRLYEGRLTVNNINEAFGSFIEKKQIISNANITLINTDKKLSSIYHSYNLSDGAVVSLYTGAGNDILNYTKFFSGIANENSGFTYDDIYFSFSVKDDRDNLLRTKMPTTVFNADLFPDFATYDSGMSIINLTVNAVPASWIPNTPLTTITGSATIVEIVGTTIHLKYYSDAITNGQTLTSKIDSTTATILSAPIPTNITGAGVDILGDTGHFLGIVDDSTSTNISFASMGGLISSIGRYPYGRSGTVTYPILNFNLAQTVTMPNSGILSSITLDVIQSISMKKVYLHLAIDNRPEITIDISSGALIEGSGRVINLLPLIDNSLLYTNANSVVTARLSTVTTADNVAIVLFTAWYYNASNIKFGLVPRRSVGGSYTYTLPIDLTAHEVTTGSSELGNLFFTRSNSVDTLLNNNVNIQVAISTDNFSTVDNPIDVTASGTKVPTQISGVDINAIKVDIVFNVPLNFIDPVELTSLFISFNTTNTIGSTLDIKNANKPIPIIYGDFTDTLVPVIKTLTSTDKTIGAAYTFTQIAGVTNGLDYTVPLAADDLCQVGDSIEYIELGGTEAVYAKITQRNPGGITTSGTIYFEDFSILPDTTKPITIARESNTYKVCDHQLQSITAYKYLPKKAKVPEPLPITITTVPDLANGEFTLIGSNIADTIYISCTGKPKADGTLLESPADIIQDLLDTYHTKQTTVVIRGDIPPAELSTIKMRRYINKVETFGDILASIEADANVHSYIKSNNTIELIRFTNSLVYTRTYHDHNVIPDSFKEEYDPDAIKLNSASFLYKNDPQAGKFNNSYDVGTSADPEILEMQWLWRQEDAEVMADQIFSVVSKTPEIINITLDADDVLEIQLGDIIRVNYRGSQHILFVYNSVKSSINNEIQLLGWNLAHGYDIGFAIPDFSEFPSKLRTGPFTYSPWLLNNKSGLSIDTGLFSVGSICGEDTLIPEATIVTQAGANNLTTSASMALVWKFTGTVTVNVTKDNGTGNFIVGTATEAQHVNNTGAFGTDAYTSILNVTTAAPHTTSVTVDAGDYLYIYISNTSITDLEVYHPTDENLASDRYNFWNPDWPFANKKFYLQRHNIPGLPNTGLCINRDGLLVDNTIEFKRN